MKLEEENLTQQKENIINNHFRFRFSSYFVVTVSCAIVYVYHGTWYIINESPYVKLLTITEQRQLVNNKPIPLSSPSLELLDTECHR